MWVLLSKFKHLKVKNCFYSDIEDKMTALFTKACDDSFVLHIAVKTNASEGFVFTAIWSTNQIIVMGKLLFCSPYRCKYKCLWGICFYSNMKHKPDNRPREAVVHFINSHIEQSSVWELMKWMDFEINYENIKNLWNKQISK